jgi:hypothetical protein
MNTPSPRTRKIATVVATPVAVLAAALLIWQSSYAAFSGTTRNSGNNWATGSVALTDDDNGTARFQATGMVPGETETRCITVTANATVPGVVKGYTVNPVLSPSGLQDYIKVGMKYGTGGGFGSCTGFAETGVVFPATSLTTLAGYNSFVNGPGNWAVTAGTQSRTYQITYTFDTTGLTQAQLDNLQNAQTGIDLQWELQSS